MIKFSKIIKEVLLMKNDAEKFPECFPDDFMENYLPKTAKREQREVYRVIKYGLTNNDSYISTCEEVLLGLRCASKRDDIGNASYYSTSTSVSKDNLEKLLKITLKKNPKVIIAKGMIEEDYGYNELTPNHNNGHIDWWKFADVEVAGFKEV